MLLSVSVVAIVAFCREETLFETLTRLSSVIQVDGSRNIINVNRDEILDGGFRGFARKCFDFRRQLSVRFVDEDGIDTGGPTREFLRLAVNAISTLPIFSGTSNARFIELDQIGEAMLCEQFLNCLLYLRNDNPST